MEKKKCTLKLYEVLILIVLGLAGSYIAFRGLNFLWSDVANYANSLNTPYIIVSFPALMLLFVIMESISYIIRHSVMEDEYKNHMNSVYLIVAGSFALVGLVTSILSGTIVYKTMFGDYPFQGYAIVGIVFHSVILIGAVVLYILNHKKKTSTDQVKKLSVEYILYTIISSLAIFMALNRFGALICSASFVDWRYLGLELPYFIVLAIPMILVINMILYKTYAIKISTKGSVILWSILTGVTLVLIVTVGVLGVTNPLLLALISPAMPIERLATIPLDYVLLFVLTNGFALAVLIHHVRLYIKEKKATQGTEDSKTIAKTK